MVGNCMRFVAFCSSLETRQPMAVFQCSPLCAARVPDEANIVDRVTCEELAAAAEVAGIEAGAIKEVLANWPAV